MIFVLIFLMVCCLIVAAIRKLSAPRCDHRIGLVEDYEGDTLYRLPKFPDDLIVRRYPNGIPSAPGGHT